jgi:hypothetical protein
MAFYAIRVSFVNLLLGKLALYVSTGVSSMPRSHPLTIEAVGGSKGYRRLSSTFSNLHAS